MLELAVLGLLKERAMHGYELKKQLGQKLGHLWQVSFGSLYPTLKRLESRGAVEAVFGGERTPRRKNVYRITPQGEAEFLELIEDRAHTSWEEDKFPLRLAFFRYLRPEVRIRLLERRKLYLQEKLHDLRRTLEQDAEPLDNYTRSLLRHGVDAMTADIVWLDDLIAAERAGTVDSPTVAETRTPPTVAETRTPPTDPRPSAGPSAPDAPTTRGATAHP